MKQPMNLKPINIASNFIDDGARFYATERRFVSPEKAAFYIGNGWATDANDPNAQALERDLEPKKLDVQSTKHVNKAPTIGNATTAKN